MTEAQAEAVVRALDELPDDAGHELRERAEAHLVLQAAHLDPRQLRRLGRAVLEAVAPDVVEAEEHRQLLAAEERARARTSLVIRRRGDGCSELRGCVLPDWWGPDDWVRRSAVCSSGSRTTRSRSRARPPPR